MAFIVPASKYRGEPAKGYIVISRDAAGQKVWQTVATLTEAKQAQAQGRPASPTCCQSEALSQPQIALS
jgi:hypothetical protein